MKRRIIWGVVLVVVLTLIILILTNHQEVQTMEKNLLVTSPAFEEGGHIPKRYTGEAEDYSPPLVLGELEEDAVSIAIYMQDLDTPLGVISHWVLWNLPVDQKIPENIAKSKTLPDLGNARQGRNFLRRIGYMGPKPPWGTHRYVFHVYVLDTALEIKEGSGGKKMLKAMDGHIIQYGTITGLYSASK